MSPYVEPGGSWRPFRLVAGVLGLVLVLDLVLPGPDVPWGLAGAVLGVVAGNTLMARRAWTVRVDARGADPALTIGRERVLLADVVDVPVSAYQVSGEYAMLEAAAANGWVDRQRAVLETLTAIRRAGAGTVLTYWAVEAARWLR